MKTALWFAPLVVAWLLLGMAPLSSAQLQVAGLQKPVFVTFDRWGVPHVSADGEHDLFLAAGFLTARDRLWQMDRLRRTALGTWAELAGEAAVQDDYQARLLGFGKQAQAAYASTPPDLKAVCEAYAAGVNAHIAWLRKHPDSMPVEYRRIGCTPRPWRPVDCLAFGRAMSFALSADLEMDLVMGRLALALGVQNLASLLSGHPTDPITITDAGPLSRCPPEAFAQATEEITAALDSWKGTLGIHGFLPGSNNWVVHGSRTASGYPMVANDPHLGLENPSIWHEMHLQCPTYNVIGCTFPGAPVILIGHNAHLAWGVTTTGYDVSDLYIEMLDPKDSKRYLHKGQSLPIEEERVNMRYKTDSGMKTAQRVIRRTLHGPVVYDALPGLLITFRWTGFKPSNEMFAFYRLNKAADVHEFHDALEFFRVGAQNFVCADDQGNILYFAPGDVPIRKGTPYLPLDGSSGGSEWTGYIPYSELPHALNPAKDYVATANNRPAPTSYPYYIGRFFDTGFRARRISDRIEQGGKLTLEDMQSIQADVYSLPGQVTKPILVSLARSRPDLLTPETQAALKEVENWDNQCETDRVGATIFHKWLRFMAKRVVEPRMPEEVKEFAGTPDIILAIIASPAHGGGADWFDDPKTPERETPEQVAAAALGDAVAELTRQFGPSMAQWQWGRIHQVTFSHPQFPDLSLGPFPRRGSIDTVDSAHAGLLGQRFDTGGGPSLRFRAEVIPGAIRAFNVIPGGQTSDPGSPHYRDQLPLWLQNRSRPMPFYPQEVQAAQAGALTLLPSAGGDE